MRIAVGALLFEGNTFSLSRTTIQDFQSHYFFEGEDFISSLRGGEIEVSGAISVLDAVGAEIVPLIATHGGCGGTVMRACFDELKNRLLARLDCGALDGVFLALHGAMICEGTENAEVELLEAVREKVGSVPIVITCDLHAHITPKMISLCDAIVGYEHYPHDDVFETGVRGAGLLVKAVSGSVKLSMQMKKLAMLVTPTMAGTRADTPMREAYKACRALESLPGILAVSYFPSTPWAERPDGGTAFVLVSDGRHALQDLIFERLCGDLWNERARFLPQLTTIDDALQEGKKIDAGPIILSEMSDAVGAGAAGDSAYLLQKYMTSGLTESFLVQIVDAGVVDLARARGVGAHIDCQLGNKVENRHGAPVSFSAEVLGFHDGAFIYSGGPMAGTSSTVGAAVVLRHKNIVVLVTSRPAYEYADEQYAAAGIDVRGFKFVVVKNPMNYRQAYSWAPRLYALDTPGAGRADLTKLEWRQCVRPFYPLDDSVTPIYRD
ncbi:M81 family metallopeptidase [Alcaligenaceae bacterium CGII-47]|nr:M81 family metallopeptidase [Alcaligenaceae bacterium CGII-47]